MLCKLYPETVRSKASTVSGITLVALVVTIIVLLILAGISLNLVMGENGILGRAENAADITIKSSGQEQAELLIADFQAEYYTNENLEKSLREYIKDKIGAGSITTSGDYFVVINDDYTVAVYSGNSASGNSIKTGKIEDSGKIAWNDVIVADKDSDNFVQGGTWTQDKISVKNGPVTLQVGQAVSGYTANEIGDGNWYVLGAKDGKLLITTNSNVTTVGLGGKPGFADGIATLNEAAEIYTNTDFAEENARTIDVDDINRVTGYDPDEAKYNDGVATLNQYGNIVTYYACDASDKKLTGLYYTTRLYYQGSKYPTSKTAGTYADLIYWTGSEWKKLEWGGSTTVKCTYYEYYPQTLTSSSGSGAQIKDIANSEEAYNLLFGSTYWLGTQYLVPYEAFLRSEGCC